MAETFISSRGAQIGRVYIVGQTWRDGGLRVRSPLSASHTWTMILDVPLPGIAGWDEIQGILPCGTSGLCRFGLAEKLVVGHRLTTSLLLQFGNHAGRRGPLCEGLRHLCAASAVFEMYARFLQCALMRRNAGQMSALLLAAGDGSPFANCSRWQRVSAQMDALMSRQG